MARNFLLEDAMKAIDAFKANPRDKETQLMIADMNRRHPIAMALLQLGMFSEFLSVTPNYYTLRKSDSANKVFTPAEFVAYLGNDKEAVADAAELDTVDDASTPDAPEKPSRKQAPQTQPQQSPLDLDELLAEDIK